jgi:transposase-like protein
MVGLVGALAHPCRAVKRLLDMAATWPDAPDVSLSPDRQWRTMRQLRTGEVDELVAAYRTGGTVYTLAEQFGIHRATVGKLLRSRGIDTTPPALTPSQIERAAELYQEGWSLAKIAKRFGVDAKTVAARLHERGIAMRGSKHHSHPVT